MIFGVGILVLILRLFRKMAFFREFDLIDDYVLIEYFYMDSSRSNPDLVIRTNIHTLSTQIRRSGYLVNRCIIVEELKRIFELLEQPYWRSYVSLTHSREHRLRNYELF